MPLTEYSLELFVVRRASWAIVVVVEDARDVVVVSFLSLVNCRCPVVDEAIGLSIDSLALALVW